MNIAPLFKNFDELADAPERIPALRKVILAYLLHSAVNSPDAASRAATLRTAHETRRGELIRRAARKEVPTVPEVADDDLPPSLSDIPTVLFDRLGNIASIEKGLSQIQSTTPGKYPLVVTAETRSSSESFDFEGAAAIIPLVSSTGHGDASLKRLHYQEGRYAVGNILAVVKPICPDLLRARFIYEYLSAFKEELLVSRMVGTANVSLTVNKLKEVPVPLVSGPVLCRIDELMALCDRLEAQQQERETRHAALARASLARFADAPTPANLNLIFHSSYSIPPADLRKSILTLAVQGKLVHRIESEGLAADILKQAGVSEEPPEDVPELPTHWIWARLGSIATRMDSGWSPACIPEPAAEGEWGVLKTTAVQTLQYQEVQNKALPPNLEPRPEHEVMDGDILFTRAGPMNRVGILCVARPTRKKLIISDKIIRFHLVVGIDPDFAALSMNAGFSSTVVEGLKSGMAASQVNISQPKLRSVPIPIPPLAEQRRIVAKVEQLMALVDALETQLAASRATAANLLSAVVAELTACRHAGASTPS